MISKHSFGTYEYFTKIDCIMVFRKLIQITTLVITFFANFAAKKMVLTL